jgi:eukaryotic-like serine/threonine-protein kinase
MVQTVPVDAGVVLGGRYKLAERLGEGGMSVVWRARDEVLARDVAVKLLSTRYLTDFSSRQRIRAEAQAAAKLSHPNIAGVFDYGESEPGVGGAGDERVPYIVMELLTGTTLAEQLEKGPLPGRACCGWAPRWPPRSRPRTSRTSCTET